MIGQNTLTLNQATMYELVEKALKANLLTDQDFKVTKIHSSYNVDYEITIMGKEVINDDN